MKRFVAMVFILMIGFFAIGCDNDRKPEVPQAEQILKGEHRLRKMAERTDVKSRTASSSFLVFGGLSTTIETNLSVKFAWEMNDGTYAISSLPIEKIRIKFDEKAIVPTIKFRWYRCHVLCEDVQKLMNDNVSYAVVTVREEDWPVQVNLPLN